MRTRPKPPSLVSMWMLDVFCCALGCVTLLWLLNTRTAAEQAQRSESALQSLAAVQADLEAVRVRFTAEVEDVKSKLIATTSERDESNRRLAVAKDDLTSLQTKLAKANDAAATVRAELAKKATASDDLAAKLAAATATASDLAKLVRDKQAAADALAMKAQAAAEQINDLDAKLATATKAATDATSALAAMRKSGDELANAKADARDVQKQLDQAKATIIDLQGDKAKLADKLDRVRLESDAKFAGIATTGKRVAFVIDTSGSMKLTDEKTPAPQKWPTVVETVGKLMRSIPDLDQYQVILFSRKARGLFNESDFRPYRGDATVKEVTEALLQVDPVGDTNLYDGLDLTFRLKASGLDTIYLLSDGLPTSGPGLSAEQDRTASDAQRTEALSRHLRAALRQWNPPGAKRVRVNAVGFFYESPEVGAFLWSLARENDGSFVGMSRP